MADFRRQMNLGLRVSADSEAEAWAVSDVWVQALMVGDYETVRRLMEAGAVRVAAADQSYPQPAPSEEAARDRRNLGAFLAAGEALRQAQDSPDTAPEDLRRAWEEFDRAKADFDPPFTHEEISKRVNAYQANLLAHFLGAATQAAQLVFVWLGLALARRQGRQDFLRCLVPFFVGDVLQLLLWFFSTFRYYIWHSVPSPLVWVFYLGDFLPNVIFVYGVAMIWQTLRPKGKADSLARLNGPYPQEPEPPV